MPRARTCGCGERGERGPGRQAVAEARRWRRKADSRRTSQDLEVHAWVGLGGIANEISLARLSLYFFDVS